MVETGESILWIFKGSNNNIFRKEYMSQYQPEHLANLTEMQALLYKTTCPACGKAGLDLTLRPPPAAKEWEYLAQCTSCHFQFAVDRSVPELGNGRPDREKMKWVVQCPKCRSYRCIISFRCNFMTRTCGYEILCPICGFPRRGVTSTLNRSETFGAEC